MKLAVPFANAEMFNGAMSLFLRLAWEPAGTLGAASRVERLERRRTAVSRP